jgi:hypothetical protein
MNPLSKILNEPRLGYVKEHGARDEGKRMIR